jgi:hypothetical protein
MEGTQKSWSFCCVEQPPSNPYLYKSIGIKIDAWISFVN